MPLLATTRATETTRRPPLAGGRWYYGWVMTWMLAGTELVSWGILYYAFSVLIVPMGNDLGWTRVEMTAAFSVGGLIAGLCGIPVGRWVDRHGARALMTIGSVGATLMVLAWSSVQTLPGFFLIWAGIGLTMSAVLYEPTFVVMATWFRRDRNRALAVLTFVGGLASVVFLPLTTWLVEGFGWREALVILAGILAVTTIVPHAIFIRRRPADLGLEPDGARRVEVLHEATGTASPAPGGSVANRRRHAGQRTPHIRLLVDVQLVRDDLGMRGGRPDPPHSLPSGPGLLPGLRRHRGRRDWVAQAAGAGHLRPARRPVRASRGGALDLPAARRGDRGAGDGWLGRRHLALRGAVQRRERRADADAGEPGGRCVRDSRLRQHQRLDGLRVPGGDGGGAPDREPAGGRLGRVHPRLTGSSRWWWGFRPWESPGSRAPPPGRRRLPPDPQFRPFPTMARKSVQCVPTHASTGSWLGKQPRRRYSRDGRMEPAMAPEERGGVQWYWRKISSGSRLPNWSAPSSWSLSEPARPSLGIRPISPSGSR